MTDLIPIEEFVSRVSGMDVPQQYLFMDEYVHQHNLAHPDEEPLQGEFIGGIVSLQRQDDGSLKPIHLSYKTYGRGQHSFDPSRHQSVSLEDLNEQEEKDK